MFLLIILLAGGLLWLLANFLLKSLFFTRRFYLMGAAAVLFFLMGYFITLLEPVSFVVFGLLLALLAIDLVFIFGYNRPPVAVRHTAERMSNGDKNAVSITVKNNYPFTVSMEVIEELPAQFQERQHFFKGQLSAGAECVFNYELRPVERGEYNFGHVIIYAGSLLGLVRRLFICEKETTIPVYPSFVQMRKYELMAQYAQTHETGSKRMRKIGHSMEFEQIKEYTIGDDIRNINWKATARKSVMMVNNYTEQRSQQVYCIIDKGRLMKMPFDNLSLLDYAINATLMLCNVSLYRQDRFGLMTFSNKPGSFLPADRNRGQLENVLKSLYNQQTAFLESDYEMLYSNIRGLIKQRSLLLLFTNFESLSGLQRQLPYLKQIAKYHLLVLVFFENTEFKKITGIRAADTASVYMRTVAEKFIHEKKIIIKELQKNGILSILTPPQNVTVDTLNKYLELKARQAI
ncbi:MAG: DUF58 domain-containing protein [Chitinophagaceae bacterium]